MFTLSVLKFGDDVNISGKINIQSRYTPQLTFTLIVSTFPPTNLTPFFSSVQCVYIPHIPPTTTHHIYIFDQTMQPRLWLKKSLFLRPHISHFIFS